MQFTHYLGDNKTHRIPLAWEGVAFEPDGEWSMVATVKTLRTDADADALIQKSLGVGMTVTGSMATLEFVPQDTEDLEESNLFLGIKAQHLSTGEVRTVADDRLKLKTPVGRETTTSIPVYTSNPPIPGGGAAVISSLTPPADLTVIWFNPALGTMAKHNGSVWVTDSTLPLISVIPLTAMTLGGEPLTLAGEILTLG